MNVELPTIVPSSDTAALLSFGDDVSLGIMARTHALARAIEAAGVAGIRSTVLGRTNVLVYFDPLAFSFEGVEALVRDLVGRGVEVRPLHGRKRELPTVYGGEFGPELGYVADFHGIGEKELIDLQTSVEYTAIFMGFAPGLAQLMGLPPQLVMARKRSPEAVRAGSIMIASQIVPIPVDSPSGWWCIGRTPVALFRPHAPEITYLLPGDTVRFTSITAAEYTRFADSRQ
jgi:KipI family sensor histidine kinase inhibitor